MIIPSIDMSSSLGKWSFIPASVGFLLGILFLISALDVIFKTGWLIYVNIVYIIIIIIYAIISSIIISK